MAEAEEQETVQAERMGSRWMYARPSEPDIREWFATVPLHRGMGHDRYLSGIVLIPQKEKLQLTKRKANGDPYVTEHEVPVYAPYVQISTRIAYFWELVDAMNGAASEAARNPWTQMGDGEAIPLHYVSEIDRPFVGVIEPVPQKRITQTNDPFRNDMLPEGFSSYAVRVYADPNYGKDVVRYVISTWRIAIYERQGFLQKMNGATVVPVLAGEGTKQVPLNSTRGWPDDSSLMKAQTGAIGRALGVGGILVVGTGVATAEDMQEVQAGPGGGGAAAQPELPPVVDREGAPIAAAVPQVAPVAAEGAKQPQAAAQAASGAPAEPKTDEELRARALALQEEMRSGYPDAWQRYADWYANDRSFPPLAELSGPALKGAVTKMERDLDEARKAAAPKSGEEAAPEATT